MTIINIYPIKNLSDISIEYRLYLIRGLIPEDDDYEKNIQYLSDKLSRETKSPCISKKENGCVYMAQPTKCPNLPEEYDLVRTKVLLEDTNIVKNIDFTNIKSDEMPLAKRFLKFYLDNPLYENQNLWRPSAGRPFFEKSTENSVNSPNIEMYRGFNYRLIEYFPGKIGICIDLSSMYASKHYLPSNIEDNEFRKYKNKKCIYEYGDNWYAINISGFHSLTVDELKYKETDDTLYDHLQIIAKTSSNRALKRLNKNSAVIVYKNSKGENRFVPSSLCRLTYKTEHHEVSNIHHKTILPPHKRLALIKKYRRKYFSGLQFLDVPLKLSNSMIKVKTKTIYTPDLLFGNDTVLTTNKHHNEIKQYTPFPELPRAKKDLIYSQDAGFYYQKILDKQILVIPENMWNTFGQKFLKDIKSKFNEMYAFSREEYQYDPQVIFYDSTVSSSIYGLGSEIINKIYEFNNGSSYGLVIIPYLNSSLTSNEDELGNFIMSKLRESDIFVSISHTDTPSKSYVKTFTNGKQIWKINSRDYIRKKFLGYIENLVLNKILLLNNCWPFILGESLETDLVIGIDVKNNTAGFSSITKNADYVFFDHYKSDQSEKLSSKLIFKNLYAYLTKILEIETRPIKSITIHRDGRIYESEINGIKKAFTLLASNGLIDKNYSINLVEIGKTTSIPIRFFEDKYSNKAKRKLIYNPRIGTYHIFENTAYLANTGFPYRFIRGTVKPIQISKIEGKLSLEDIISDVFKLSNLTWTKIDSCMKVPISIKFTDIHLREFAGEFSEVEFDLYTPEGENLEEIVEGAN